MGGLLRPSCGEVPTPTRVTVDVSAIRDNVKAYRKIVGPDVILAPAVKANGYGHGSGAVAKAAIEGSADWLSVASIAEAVDLREQGTFFGGCAFICVCASNAAGVIARYPMSRALHGLHPSGKHWLGVATQCPGDSR